MNKHRNYHMRYNFYIKYYPLKGGGNICFWNFLGVLERIGYTILGFTMRRSFSRYQILDPLHRFWINRISNFGCFKGGCNINFWNFLAELNSQSWGSQCVDHFPAIRFQIHFTGSEWIANQISGVLLLKILWVILKSRG